MKESSIDNPKLLVDTKYSDPEEISHPNFYGLILLKFKTAREPRVDEILTQVLSQKHNYMIRTQVEPRQY